MKPRLVICSFLAAVALALSSPGHAAGPDSRYIIERVQGLIERASGLPLDIRNLAPELRSYYFSDDARLLWTAPDRCEGLIAALQGLEAKGLTDTARTIKRLSDMGQAIRSSDANLLALVEVTYSSYLLRHVRELRLGRMDLYAQKLDARTRDRVIYADAVLRLAGKAESFDKLFDDVQPREPDYVAIRARLEDYVALSKRGGWLPVAPGDDLARGDRGPRVIDVRRRLAASGELADDGAESDQFDEPLAAAVRLFQRRHGLAQTGRVDRRTLLAMNVPLSDRIDQLRVNLERWRWFDDPAPAPRWIINTATQTLYVRLPDNTERPLKVAVSKACRERPAFDTTVRQVILDPAYTVPQSLAVRHLLPLLKANAQKLDKSFTIYLEATDRHPNKIDWRAYNDTNFPFTIIQQPGPTNWLGHFQMPFDGVGDISLHGQPDVVVEPKLQEACVAIPQAAGALSALLPAVGQLAGPPPAENGPSHSTRAVQLERPVPVVFVYATIWRDSEGELVFAADPLGRDTEIHRLMQTGRVS